MSITKQGPTSTATAPSSRTGRSAPSGTMDETYPTPHRFGARGRSALGRAVAGRDRLTVPFYGGALFFCWGLAGPVSGSQPDPGGAHGHHVPVHCPDPC